MFSTKQLVLSIGLVCGSVFPSPHISAEEAVVLEQILISSRKKIETVQEVPISVVVVEPEQLQESNITNLEELSSYLPGVVIGKTGADDSLFIRGVGSGVNLGFERSVGTYVDGVYMGRGKQSRSAFLDLERIEVLKGPQGILFGKNTIAGAISLTSIEPTEKFSGYIEALYEPDAGETDTRFAISNTLFQGLRGRLAGRYHAMDGYLENEVANDDEPDIDEYAMRGTLIWDASNELEIALRGDISHFDETGSNLQLYRVDPNKPTDAFGYTIGPVTARLDDKSDTGVDSNGDIFTRSKYKSETFSATVNYFIDDYSFTSITAYSDYGADIVADADYSLRDILTRTTDEDFNQLSQEFRLLYQPDGPFGYIGGIYYEKTSLDIAEILDARIIPGVVFADAINVFEQEGQTLAVFGQLTWDITDRLQWSLGLRYGEDEKDLDKVVRVIGPSVSILAADYANNEQRRNSEFTWSSSMQYVFSPDMMVYLSAGTGYKDGGYDQFYLGTFDSNSPQLVSLEFDEETVTSVELGFKSTLLQGAMSLNAALFRSEYEDLQTSALTGATFAVVNAGKSITQGLELDIKYAISEDLLFGTSLSFLDASYDEFTNAACTASQIVSSNNAGEPNCTQDLSGEPLQYAPDVAANVYAEWRLPVNDSVDFVIRTDVNYTDSFFTAQDEDAFTESDSYTKINLRLALAESLGAWELALIAKNLTDEKTSLYINDAPLNVLSNSTQVSESYFARTDRMRTLALHGIYRF